MNIRFPDLPDATRVAVDRAAGILARSTTVLTAADLFADRAQQRLDDARARADLLRTKMADIKDAGQRVA
jgi:hypothetical protein